MELGVKWLLFKATFYLAFTTYCHQKISVPKKATQTDLIGQVVSKANSFSRQVLLYSNNEIFPLQIFIAMGDLSQKENCLKIVDDTIKQFGRVDVLVRLAILAPSPALFLSLLFKYMHVVKGIEPLLM